MIRCNSSIRRRCSGLATLEMVLATPFLLMVMALMLNYGTVAAWKVRGLTAARHAAWSSRWPRAGLNYPRPENWPTTAQMGRGGQSRHAPMDDPRVYHPVARGPSLPYGTTVNQWLLDPSRGFTAGHSHLDRDFPLLKKIGPYSLTAESNLIDDTWEFQRFGLVSNESRRIPVIYALARAPATNSQGYVRAAMAIVGYAKRQALAPLDRDDEFIGYAIRFGWGTGAPDFHPRLQQFCSLDTKLADDRAKDLIDHIKGKVERDAQGRITRKIPSVAETMTHGFINLYQRVIRELQNQINAVPPPDPGQVMGMQAEIKTLQGKIDVLQKYLQTL